MLPTSLPRHAHSCALPAHLGQPWHRQLLSRQPQRSMQLGARTTRSQALPIRLDAVQHAPQGQQRLCLAVKGLGQLGRQGAVCRCITAAGTWRPCLVAQQL